MGSILARKDSVRFIGKSTFVIVVATSIFLSGFLFFGNVAQAAVSFEVVGGGTAEATSLQAFSGNESVGLQVIDGTTDMAAVVIPVDVALGDITSLKFYQRLANGAAAFGANIILGVDANENGTYDANDLAWHVGQPHSSAVLNGDTFLEMDGVPITDSWANIDAMSVGQWWTTNAAGDGLSSDCYKTLPNFFTCSNMNPGLNSTSRVKVIKLVIGGSGSWMNLAVFVDSLELNGNVIISAPVTIGTEKGFNTIQSAVDAANPDDTINVAAGTYVEDVQIPGDKSSLVITGKGIDVTTLDGGIRTSGDNTSISGMTVNGGGSWGDSGNDFPAIWLEGGTSGHVITDVKLVGPDNNTRRGLVFGIGVSSVEVTGVETLKWLSGVYINPSNNLTFTDLKVHNNFAGIGSDGISDTSINQSIFTDNEEGFGASSVGENVVVSKSSFIGNTAGIAHYGGEIINAVQNYWGAASGPAHSSNPSGTGNSVSDNVSFSPWYTNAEKTSLAGQTETSLDGESETLTLSTAVEITTDETVVTIPENTVVTGPTGWTGEINAPTVGTVASALPSISGSSAVVNSIIEIGFPDKKLTFSNAVRLLFPDQEAGRKIGYARTGESFHEITTVCNEDTQTAADAQLTGEVEDCKIDTSPDLVVWTKHFTQFITYALRVANSGGGGGGASETTVASVTPTPAAPTGQVLGAATSNLDAIKNQILLLQAQLITLLQQWLQLLLGQVH